MSKLSRLWLSLHRRLDKARLSAKTSVVLGLLIAAGCGSSAFADQFSWRDNGEKPLVLKQMGSFMVGGTVVTTPGDFNPMNPTPAGQTLSGDHTYVQFEIPQGAVNRNAMLMWGSLVKTPWETTPDGRDGFEQIFLRQKWSVYLADRPRMGEAARTTVGTTITPTAGEQGFFIQFRLGLCSAGSPPVQCNLYPGSKFPPGPAALDQFNRWLTQSVGPGDATLTLNDLLAIVNKIGPTVLVTHSASSLSGYEAAMQNPNIKGIIGLESTGVPCPSDNPFPPVVGNFGTTTCTPVDPTLFKHLAEIPILMEFGDNIPSGPSNYFGLDFWYRMHAIDLEFKNAVNALGGHVTLLELTKKGIKGNTHFAFTDLNNAQVAGLIQQYLSAQGLAK
jgi:hypothetical protein